METGDRSTAKKARVESPPRIQVKQEAPGDEEAASGESALMVLGGDAADATRAEVAVRIERGMLHCPLCTLPLKPPIFQCGVGTGYVACGSCYGQLAAAGAGGTYAPCPSMDAFISKVLVPCPHEAYGCRASIAYYLAGDHGDACAYAPCACGEPGCAFLGTPPKLLAHLAAAPHCWPVSKVKYSNDLFIRVPETESRRLLVAEDGVGGERVFVLAVGDRAARAVAVTLACVRSPRAAAAGLQFTCKMCATGPVAAASGKVEVVLVDMEVPSDMAAGAVAADEADTFLSVPRKMLHGASRELHLNVRIHRV